MQRGKAGLHLIWHVPQASRACLGRALNARRRTHPAEEGRAPHADTLPAALGLTFPLPDDVVPLFGSPDEAGVMAALDEIAQQISEGRSITLVDSATTHPGAGAAAPLAAWLAQRADELRAADDAQVLDDICRRDASAAPTTAEVDATAATTAEALRAEIVGEAPTEGQAPRHAVHTAQPRGLPTRRPSPAHGRRHRRARPIRATRRPPGRHAPPQPQRQRRAAHGVPPAAPQRALRGHRSDGRAAPPARSHVQRGGRLALPRLPQGGLLPRGRRSDAPRAGAEPPRGRREPPRRHAHSRHHDAPTKPA